MVDLTRHVIKALNKANTFDTKLPRDIILMPGMSGFKTRIFYNEVCSLMFEGRKTNYLEVGVWKGSSTCSALYGNENLNTYVVENWSEFSGPKNEFETNMKRLVGDASVTIIEDNFDTFDISRIKDKIDVYLYDGDHTEESHVLALERIWPCLADESIFIVDDWNFPSVQQGTRRALQGKTVLDEFIVMYNVGLEHQYREIFSPPMWHEGEDKFHTRTPVAHHEFWNGIAIFILQKKPRPDTRVAMNDGQIKFWAQVKPGDILSNGTKVTETGEPDGPLEKI
jgi:hypothetical protein